MSLANPTTERESDWCAGVMHQRLTTGVPLCGRAEVVDGPWAWTGAVTCPDCRKALAARFSARETVCADLSRCVQADGTGRMTDFAGNVEWQVFTVPAALEAFDPPPPPGRVLFLTLSPVDARARRIRDVAIRMWRGGALEYGFASLFTDSPAVTPTAEDHLTAALTWADVRGGKVFLAWGKPGTFAAGQVAHVWGVLRRLPLRPHCFTTHKWAGEATDAFDPAARLDAYALDMASPPDGGPIPEHPLPLWARREHLPRGRVPWSPPEPDTPRPVDTPEGEA